MDDVVAVEITLKNDERRFVITFGRLHDTVDPTPLERLVLSKCNKFGLATATSARVCWSLQAASDQPYFHECMSEITTQRAIARMSDDDGWWDRTRAEMDTGRHLYYLGEPLPPGVS